MVLKQEGMTLVVNEYKDQCRSLAESSQVFSWTVDLSTARFTSVGPQAEAMFGYPLEAWYEEGFWLRCMHPDDRTWVPRFCEEAVSRLESHECEYRMYTANGDLLWIRDRVNVEKKDDKPIALHGFMINITDQKKKEEDLLIRQQHLLESQRIAHVGHWKWDVTEQKLHWSDEIYRIYGFEPQQFPASYEAFLESVYPEDRSMVKKAVSEALREDNYSIDHRIVRPNGVVRVVHEQAEVQYDAAGKATQMFGTVQDITERKHLEYALDTMADYVQSNDITECCRTCVENLARVYNTSYAFVGLFSDDSRLRIKTQAVWVNGRFADNFEYDLAGTPCADVLERHKELIPEHASILYPDDTLLKDMGVEGYFGAPLLSVSGNQLGIIAILDTQPMEIASWTESILGIFAQRIASHIEFINAEEMLRSSEKELRNIFCNMQDTYYCIDHAGFLIRLSDSVYSLLGYQIDELVGENITEIYLDSHGQQALIDQLNENDGSIQDYEIALRHKDGSIIWGSVNAHYYRDKDERILGVEGMIRDITEFKESRLQMHIMSKALQQSADMVLITDCNGVVEYINPAFEKITGYSINEVIGGSPDILRSGKQSQDFYKKLWDSILSGEVFRDVFVNRKKNGELYYEEKSIAPVKDSKGLITHFISTGHDITQRMKNEDRLSFMAHHDALTNLPNRNLFMDRLKQSLAHARRYSKKVAVLFMDLDRFKGINDSLGHEAGDEVLRQLAARLEGSVRNEDTIARLGGDEFVILLSDIEVEQDVTHLARTILRNIELPFEVVDRELFVTASIGISLFPGDGDVASTLLKHADIAMYKAKELGRNNYQFYSDEMSARILKNLTLESKLHRALERDEFVLHYQPQFNTETGVIVGVEALIRWQNPDLGLIPPNDFIPMLEETGMIAKVGYWVVSTACKQLRAWNDAGFSDLMMSVNISGRQFHARDFIQEITRQVQQSGVLPQQLEIEITESVLIEDQVSTISSLQALEALGFRIAIDDFGTGYSSLSYLRRFNVDTLKVDKSFVDDVVDDHDAAAITTAIIVMGHSLNMHIIAEGVETQQQLEFLHSNDCYHVQGYLFSRPLPAEEVTALLMNR